MAIGSREERETRRPLSYVWNAGGAMRRALPELSLAKHPRPARARQQGIRTKPLRFLDSISGKQVVTGQRRRIGNDFRHQRGSGGKRVRAILSYWVHGSFLSS